MAGGLRNVNAVVTITTNAVKAIEDGKKLKEVYAAINQQLNLMRAEGKTDTTEFKEMQKLAEDTKLKIDALVSGMKLIRGVVDNLANKQGRDLNRALRETSKEFNRTANDTDKHKAKLEQLRQSVAALKRELSDRKGLTMSFTDAQKQLQNLANTPLDKLRAGLASIRAELEGDINSKTRAKLQGWENQYAAQIAIKETGTIPTSSLAGVQQADRTRLEAERERLVKAYNVASMSEDKQHIQWSNLALQRIQALNGALKQLNEEEQKRDKATRDAAAAKDRFNQAERVSANVASGTKQSIQDLTDAYKNYGEYLKTVEGVNQPEADRVKANMQDIKQALTDISQIDVQKTISSLTDPNATTNLEQMEEALKKLKENASQIGMHDDAGFQKYTEDVAKLEAAIDQVKLKLQGLADIDYAHLENYSTEKLQAELKNLENQEKKLAGTQKQEAELVARKKTLISDQLKKNEVAVTDFANAEKIAAERGKHSVTEMQMAYDALKVKLLNLSADEREAIKQTRKQMDQLKKDINSVTGEVSGLQKVWKSAVRNIATYAGLFAGFGFVKSKIQEVMRSTINLSDSMAQVQKVTGLTKQEVDKLNVSFAKLDTRTALSELNDIAYSAGKMGLGKYGVEGIRQFVESANQLQVALGDDLGSSVEESITPLAKLAENLGLIQKMGVEKSMLAIGSSINELSQTTTAAGRNIVDFARRIQPAAQMIGLTTDEILALGSASDSFGVASEISATAFTKFLAAYRTNAEEIERILGLTKGSLDQFFEQGRTMEGFLAIFQRMHEIGDLRYLEEAFKALGSEGSRMFTTFGAFSKNIDMFREHLETSTKAFKEATSVTREYNLVQETAAGLIQRAGNIWEKAFVNPEGVDTMKELAAAWYDLSKELTSSTTYMTEVKVSLMSIAAVAKVLIQMLPILIRLMMFYGVGKVLQGLIINFNAIYRSLTLAGTAAARFNLLLKTNAIAIAVTVLGYLATKWLDVAMASKNAADATEDSTKAMERAKQAQDTYNNTMSSNYSNLMSKYDQLKREWSKLKNAHEKNEWIKKNKTAFDELGLSVTGAASAEEIFNKNTEMVIEGFKRRAEAAALAAKMTQLYNQQMDIETEAQEYLSRYGKNAGDKASQSELPGRMEADASGGTYNNGKYRYDQSSGSYVYTAAGALEYNRKILKGLQSDYNNINKQIDDTANRMEALGKKPFTPGAGGAGGGSGSGSGVEKAPEWMVEEKKEAEKATKAVIGSIEEFYRLQEAAANELAANGQLKGADFERMVSAIQDRKDKMLLEARRAIVGDPNEFEQIRQRMSQDIIKRDDQVSQAAMQRVMEAEPAKAGEKLRKYNGSDAVYGLDSNAHLNDIRKNAAQNELNIQRRQAKVAEEVDKILMQYQFVEQAQKSFGDKLVTLGLVTEGYDKIVKQLADGTEVVANTKDVQALSEKVISMGVSIFDVDIEDPEGLANKISEIFTDNKGVQEAFASIFPDLDKWMEKPEQYKQAMQAFYQTLLDYDKAYYEAIKKSYDKQKKIFEERWEVSGKGQAYSNVSKQIDIEGRQQKMTGADQGTNFAQMAGFATVGADPEVQASLVRMAQMQEELEMFKQTNEAKNMSDAEREAFMQGVHEREMALKESEIAMQETLMSKINEHISRLSEWTQPIEQFGQDVGDALGQALFQGESFADGMRSALQSLVKSWGESTIQIVKQLMMQQLKQKLVGKMMVKETKQTQGQMTDITEEGGENRLQATNIVETGMASVMQTVGNQMLQQKQAQDTAQAGQDASRVTGETMMGIAGAAARIMETLGPWGAPLIAVVTALLMGLLSMALSALGGGNKETNTNTSAKKNVKLASGMLTYDEGNVQQYVGQDGHVYRAREQRALPEGVSIVKEPIATTVNGQPALVGEKGPEIVIGRRTSKRIMMNEPGLLRSIMQIERGGRFYTGGRGMRLFDEGNLGETVGQVAVPQQQSERDQRVNEALAANAAALEQNAAAMAAFSEVMAAIRANGIQGVFREYGAGSLDESMRKVNAFRKRYPV